MRAPCDPRDHITLRVSPSPGLLPTTYQRLASPSFDQPPPTPTAHSPGALPLLLSRSSGLPSGLPFCVMSASFHLVQAAKPRPDFSPPHQCSLKTHVCWLPAAIGGDPTAICCSFLCSPSVTILTLWQQSERDTFPWAGSPPLVGSASDLVPSHLPRGLQTRRHWFTRRSTILSLSGHACPQCVGHITQGNTAGPAWARTPRSRRSHRGAVCTWLSLSPF